MSVPGTLPLPSNLPMLRDQLGLGPLATVQTLTGLSVTDQTLSLTGSSTTSMLFANGTVAAPSISFANDTSKGFYFGGSNSTIYATGGARSLNFGPNGALYGAESDSQFLSMPSTGAIALTAGGTNQNILVTVSGTGATVFNAANHIFRSQNTATEYGRFNPAGMLLLGTNTDSSNGRLQLATHTTSTGGIGFGTDVSLYHGGAGELKVSGSLVIGTNLITAGAASQFVIQQTGDNYSVLLKAGSSANYGYSIALNARGGGDAMVFSTRDVTALTLDASQNATFAGTIKPQQAATASAPAYVKGAIYFDTTLNKLRVGGATAWETITSV